MLCQEEFPSALKHLQSRAPHLSDVPCCEFLTQYQLIPAAGIQGSLRALLVTKKGAGISPDGSDTEQLLAHRGLCS